MLFFLCSVTSVAWSPSRECGGTVRTVLRTTLSISAPTALTGEIFRRKKDVNERARQLYIYIKKDFYFFKLSFCGVGVIFFAHSWLPVWNIKVNSFIQIFFPSRCKFSEKGSNWLIGSTLSRQNTRLTWLVVKLLSKWH